MYEGQSFLTVPPKQLRGPQGTADSRLGNRWDEVKWRRNVIYDDDDEITSVKCNINPVIGFKVK